MPGRGCGAAPFSPGLWPSALREIFHVLQAQVQDADSSHGLANLAALNFSLDAGIS